MNIKIKDIPIYDRPRERLKLVGVSNLSDEELLSIILKVGTKNVSVKVLSSSILSKIGGIAKIKEINYEDIINIKGVGEAKAASLIALSEILKRANRDIIKLETIKVTSPKVIFDYYKSIIGDKKQEYFYTVYLDNKKTVIKDKLLFIGTINRSIIHPREIFKEAYLSSASSIICVHNHPSNSVIPSEDDIMVTKKLKEAGDILGITINDHIIVGSDSYYSFYENDDI